MPNPSNRLAHESSPYLLQHAQNPVDWYPWGEEALAKSQDEDKPIFLSIGYSACHWCHVMEHESFENDGIAHVLNDNFVCIKVDREERPDLDQIYMNAVMALRGGGGGWPLSVFLTPTQQVFFGGTYWPPKSRMGMPGFDHVLMKVMDAFTNRREEIEEQSQKITEWLNEKDTAADTANGRSVTEDHLTTAMTTLERSFDFQNGGFGSAPKFPHAMDLDLMVLVSRRWEGKRAEALRHMASIGLRKMAYGGIFDHLGGGFARYSVDEKWLVPHFEKMLYDNSLLTNVYLEMFAVTGDEFYSNVIRETLGYLIRDMVDPGGGIYSTEDADSEGEEGKFYVWSKPEVVSALGDTIGERFCKLYDVTEQGNFEGHNILNLPLSFEEFAKQEEIGKDDLTNEMRAARKKLFDLREDRIRPGLDDKVLVSWNGLGISAFARAGALLNEPTYVDAASRAADFVWEKIRRKDGRLLHTWRGGVAKLDGYLDDYSYLIVGLLDLYSASFDPKWIRRATQLTEMMVEYFITEDENGFYFTASDHETLIARQRSFQDSSVPSGNSMAALALLRLGRLVGNVRWLELAEKTITSALPLIERSPLASGKMLIAAELLLNASPELVLVADDLGELSDVLEKIRRQYSRHVTVICRIGDGDVSWNGSLSDKKKVEGQPTLYLCENFSCKQPVAGVEEILKSLG